MDDDQKSSHSMGSKRAQNFEYSPSDSGSQINQSPKAEDESEDHESTEYDSRKIESERMAKSENSTVPDESKDNAKTEICLAVSCFDEQTRIRKELDIKESTSNPECQEKFQSETGRQRSNFKEISNNTSKTPNYSVSEHLKSSFTQEQNKTNTKYRVDRGKYPQLNTCSFQDRNNFTTAGLSYLGTDQQRTAVSNPFPYDQGDIWKICETSIKDCKTAPVTCPLCRWVFREKALLDLHMLDHTAKGCMKCYKCGRWFINIRSLRRHRTFNLSCDQYRCEFCQECFRRPMQLELHRRNCNIRPKEQEVKFKDTLKSVNSPASSGSKSAVDFRAKLKSEFDSETKTKSCEDQNDKNSDSSRARSELKTTYETQHYSVARHSHSSFTQKDSKPNEEDRMDTMEYLQSKLSSFQHQIDLAEPGPSHQSTYQQRAQKLRDEAEVHFECIACSRPFANYRDFKHHYPLCRKLLESTKHGRNEFNSQSDNSDQKMEKNLKCERCSRRFSKEDDCKKHMIENPFCYMQYKCPICSKYLASNWLLQEHSTIHHEN